MNLLSWPLTQRVQDSCILRRSSKLDPTVDPIADPNVCVDPIADPNVCVDPIVDITGRVDPIVRVDPTVCIPLRGVFM